LTDRAGQERNVAAHLCRFPAMLAVDDEVSSVAVRDQQRRAQAPIPFLGDRQDQPARGMALCIALIGTVDLQAVGGEVLNGRRLADRRLELGHAAAALTRAAPCSSTA
jgi:hypothetical protein